MQLFGITKSQWFILAAIAELNEGRGVPGIAIANKLHIHPGFVTNQTRKLEAMDFLIREPSLEDARCVQMIINTDVQVEIAKLSIKRQALNSTMVDGLDEASLDHLIND